MGEELAKTERVQVRIDRAAKRRLERAAALANTTVSAFVVNHALAARRSFDPRARAGGAE